MPVLKQLKHFALSTLASVSERRILSNHGLDEIDPANFPLSLIRPDAFYRRAHRYFHLELEEEIRTHRIYFRQQRRGFGEDAFHTLWWFLLKRYRPVNFLEIGVYRGQTLSLAALISRITGFPCEIHGISPLAAADDSVSEYLDKIDYQQDLLSHFDHFTLPHPILCRAFSTEPEALTHIKSRLWDMIYIDGNHDYEVVINDWKVCAKQIRPGGCIVLDDAGLGSNYRPPRFATAGHPGPSRVAAEIAPALFTEILQVGHNRVFQRNVK